jgi:hypothetical protein
LFGRTVLTLVQYVWPWGLTHLLAVPFALWLLGCSLIGARTDAQRRPRPDCSSLALLAAFYLGWLGQVVYLQRGFAYQQVPAILLALTLLTGWAGVPGRSRWAQHALAGLAVLLLLSHPLLRLPRTALWGRCWAEGSSVELRDRLALTEDVDWQDLQPIADYLRDHEVHDAELTCMDWRTVQLYMQLGIHASTRYLFFSQVFDVFARHRPQLHQELFESPQRYVVCDLCDAFLSRAEVATTGPTEAPTLPHVFPASLRGAFPWTQPLVFRCGRYVVFRVGDSSNDRAASGSAPALEPVNHCTYATSR